MRNIEIISYGTKIPENTVEFAGEIRHRCNGDDTQLSMAVDACNEALKKGNLTINDIDCIVSTSAVQLQPIPCTAALIHEKIALGTNIPAMDINTTCTSFVTALDVLSYMIHDGRYKKVLIVASEQASLGLNPNQKESFELFGDGAAAIVISKTNNKDKGVIHSVQKTWSEGAHDTEIRGGLSLKHPKYYSESNKEDYMFDMNGLKVLRVAARKLPELFKNFYAESGLTIEDIDMVIPHQASKALDMIMPRIGIPKNKYVNMLKLYGNMVSASIPFTLCKALDEQIVKENDTLMLMGTAAGLTANVLVLKI